MKRLAYARLVVLSAFLFCLSTSASIGAVVYVNREAAGPTHDGKTWATAFTGIQAALNAAVSGDELWVSASAPDAPAYVESITVPPIAIALYGGFAGTETDRSQRNWKDHPIVVEGGTEPGVVASGVPSATLDGFTIRGGSDGVAVYSSTVTIANCIISGNTANGIYAPSGTATVSNCTISGNAFSGIDIERANVTATNCTITANFTGVSIVSRTATLTNCIVAFNDTGISSLYDSVTAAVLSHCDIFGNASADFVNVPDPTGITGNIRQDPQLSNAFHDEHLQPGSPCIDAGDDSVAGSDQTDLYGKRRIAGAHVDIGSDESDGTTWPAQARTWYVSPTGDDTQDGTSWTHAVKTVGAALRVSRGGDEVWVARGTYVENESIPAGVALYGGFAGAETARSQRDWIRHATVLDGGADAASAVITSMFLSAVLDGFTVRNGMSSNGGIYVGSGSLAVRHCSVTGNAKYGIDVYSAGRSPTSRASISDSILSGNATGAFAYGGLLDVTNCTVSKNASSGIDVRYGGPDRAASVTNCIIAFNGMGISESVPAVPLTLSHNDVFGNTNSNYIGTADPTGTNGNISQDPRLSNAYHDTHIQPGSPCIDAGDDSASIPGETDYFGKSRVIGPHVDIGADESDGTVWPPTTRVWHVAVTGNDSNDGSAWATAKRTIGAALSLARGPDEVWVGKGTFGEYVTLPSGVSIYGGFAGTEVDPAQRDWRANATVIEGSGTGNVVTSSSAEAVIDGLTIRNGRIDVLVQGGTATVNNCILTDSQYGIDSGPNTATITNCQFSRNRSGVFSYTAATVADCTFSGNTYGVVAELTGAVDVSRCTFTDNTAGVMLESSSVSAVGVVTNCVFTGNGTAVRGYGITTVADCTLSSNSYAITSVGALTVTNCTITGNAYGVYVTIGTAKVANTIVSFNQAGVYPASTNISMTLSHNDVYGNSANYINITEPTGTSGNISQDPRLSNPYHDVHVQPGSPCIDSGDDAAIQPGWIDIDGQPRLQGAHVDIGSDESDGTIWTVTRSTRFVSPSGDDAGDGLTWATAKRTVGAALAAAQGMDEVWVARGTYVEAVSIPAGVSLYGGFAGTEADRGLRNWKTNVTMLDGNGNPTANVVTGFPGAILDGFTVRNGGNGVALTNGPMAIAHCVLTGNAANGILVSLGSATVSNCTVSGNATGITMSSYDSTTTIANSTLSGNYAAGVENVSGLLSVLNCTITANATYGISTGSPLTTTVSNSIVAFNQTGVYRANPNMPVAFSRNDVYGNVAANFANITNPTGTNGNISQDPMLSNPYHDAHIQAGSPCVDAGLDSVVKPGWTDIDDQARIVGAHVDIGSDESDGSTWMPAHTVWYVAPTGDDAFDGTSWARAKRTLAGAMAVAQGADEVWVGKGIYRESITIPAGISIYGGFAGTEAARSQRDWRANETAIEASGTDAFTAKGQGTVLDGLVVRNSASGIAISGGSAGIAHCTVTGNTYGVRVTGGTSTILDCAFSANPTAAIYAPSGTLNLARCTIDSSQYGVLIGTGAVTIQDTLLNGNSSGIYVEKGKATVTGCTICGSLTNGAFLSAGSLIATNCIVAYNATGIRRVSPAQVTVSHTDAWGNSTSNYGGMSDPTGTGGNISADPLFTDRAGGNFRLVSGSPCIDSGADAAITMGEADLGGGPRRIGAHVDIGAYEYGSVYFTVADAARALMIAGGLRPSLPADLTHLGAEPGNALDLVDAARLVRKAQGLDLNP